MLCRVLDHGDSAPTCVGWFAALGGVYIAFREYYVANRLISYHRQAIADLSGNENYESNYADPSIFKRTSQKSGGFWTVADEYKTADLKAPTLFWQPADNNEFATRNRINELLAPKPGFRHPVTGESPAPGLYFIESSESYPNGCREIIRQTAAQRKLSLGTIDGKTIYSDDRDENITDHGYDVVRYYCAMHGTQPRQHERRPPRNSFAYFNALLRRQQLLRIA